MRPAQTPVKQGLSEGAAQSRRAKGGDKFGPQWRTTGETRDCFVYYGKRYSPGAAR